VIESTGSAFVEEVRGSLDYYLAQPGAARIGRVVLSGGGSRLGGLVERLSAATRLPVEAARPMSVLKIGKTGLAPEQLAFVEPMVAVPVGLAMGVSS
jgi:type IV pilus assembly protein PilM